MDGIVASPAEAAAVRAIVGPDIAIVTPGIRPAGAGAGDQKRIATPAAAIQAGADYLVVGRPITGASDPKSAADAIVAEISLARPPLGAGRRSLATRVCPRSRGRIYPAAAKAHPESHFPCPTCD